MARKTKPPETSPSEGRSCRLPLIFLGMLLAGLAVFLMLSFLTADIRLDPTRAARHCATGLLGSWAAFGMLLTLGRAGSYLLMALLFAWGALIMKRQEILNTWPRVLGGLLLTATASLLVPALTASDALLAGGLLAHKLAPPAMLYFGRVGLILAGLVFALVGLVLAFGTEVFDVIGFALRWCGIHGLRGGRVVGAGLQRGGAVLRERVGPQLAAALVTRADRALVLVRPQTPPEPFPDEAPDADECGIADDDAEYEVEAAVIEEEPEEREIEVMIYDEPPKHRLKPRKRGNAKPKRVAEMTDYQLPPLPLLDEPTDVGGGSADILKKRARILEATLQDFKIKGEVVRIERGPRVTQFEMTLAPGIKLSKVVGLADNLSLSLKAPSIRIVAPIPGKDTIGIEIPNIEQEMVYLREVIEDVDRDDRRQRLPLCLAKDVSGAPIVADLTTMPHLLIAGATGSGKSVCINSIIMSFLMCCKPWECKLIMVDPKVVELSRFKTIPHLMSPVITDMKRAVNVLEWATQEMDKRYEQLSKVNVNNIVKYNAMAEETIRQLIAENYGPEEAEEAPGHLPFIVIIIDELADLMMVAGKDVEQHITRLAAKSRAVGIHLILATQRPSVDVITGLIKANMPCRIAFQVTSRVDSRTILDANGAETLLGRGDMLYLPPGVSKMIRSQGVYVSDEELDRVVDFCKEQLAPEFHEDLEGPVIGGAKADDDISDYDDLFYDGGCAILESGRGSVSLLQRKLGIGYGRSSRMIDQLAEAGVLGPFREGKAREILMTMEEFQARFGGTGGGVQGTLAGLREDEYEREDVPWDDEE